MIFQQGPVPFMVRQDKEKGGLYTVPYFKNIIILNVIYFQILKNKIENDSTLLMECFETLSNLSKLPEFNFLPSKTADKILKLLALPWINEMKFKELSVDSTILGILEACKLHIKGMFVILYIFKCKLNKSN